MKESLGIVFNIPYIKQRTGVSTNSKDPFAMSKESGISQPNPILSNNQTRSPWAAPSSSPFSMFTSSWLWAPGAAGYKLG